MTDESRFTHRFPLLSTLACLLWLDDSICMQTQKPQLIKTPLLLVKRLALLV